MSFGTGQFKRSKWVWLCWSGEAVGPMQRGQFTFGDIQSGALSGTPDNLGHKLLPCVLPPNLCPGLAAGGTHAGMQTLLSPYQVAMHASTHEQVSPEVVIERIKVRQRSCF